MQSSNISFVHLFGHHAPNSTVLYRLDESEDFFKLYFHRPYSGAAVILCYEIQENDSDRKIQSSYIDLVPLFGWVRKK